jgi:hypothetical protein
MAVTVTLRLTAKNSEAFQCKIQPKIGQNLEFIDPDRVLECFLRDL